MKASASILIKRTKADTFTAFTDVAKRTKYLPMITKLKIHSLNEDGKDVEWHEERTEDGVKKQGTLAITNYTKPRAFTITTHSAGLIFKTRYNFQEAGAGATKVVVSIGGRPKGILAGVMSKFLNRNSVYMGQQLQNELESFKEVLEAEA